MSRHGGYSEYQRVPAGWVVPLAAGLAPREAMSIGTAGFTAAMSVSALEARGLEPADGPVLVTGASGGVGGTAVAILAERGYEVWAATGKDDEADRLRTLGAAGILTRDEVTARGPAARLGTLGGRRRRGRRGHAAVHPSHAADRSGGRSLGQRRRGRARDHGLPVHPPRRRAARDGFGGDADRTGDASLWDRLATDLRPRDVGRQVTEVTLDTLDEALDGILAGAARGRWIVRIGG